VDGGLNEGTGLIEGVGRGVVLIASDGEVGDAIRGTVSSTVSVGEDVLTAGLNDTSGIVLFIAGDSTTASSTTGDGDGDVTTMGAGGGAGGGGAGGGGGGGACGGITLIGG